MRNTFAAFALAVHLLGWIHLYSATAQNNNSSKKDRATEREEPGAMAIKKLIQQMGSPNSAERDASMKRLESIGKPALSALREAANNNDDAEIRRRAQRLIERLSPIVDPLEESLKEAIQHERKKDYKKAAELLDKLFEKANEIYHPGTAAPLTDIPFLTEVSLKLASARTQLGDYEKAAIAYQQATYYSNFNNEKRGEIQREWSVMTTHLLGRWDGIVQKNINNDTTLKALTAKHPLVLLHTRRFAGGGYLQSAYSFLYETSEETKHFNDVQLLFDNGRGENTFHLNCAVGQENRIADFGKVDFTKDPDPTRIGTDGKARWCSEDCKAVEGHVYLEEIKDSRGNHFFVLFHVVATDKDSRFVAFVWRKLPGGTVVKRP